MMVRMYELAASEREDGSIYYTCPALPGFHFILAKGENVQTTLIPSFKHFMSLSDTGSSSSGIFYAL